MLRGLLDGPASVYVKEELPSMSVAPKVMLKKVMEIRS